MSDKTAVSPALRKPKLLDELRATIRRRHYSRRTEEAYADWVRRFVRFHGLRHPAELGEREVETFLSDLAVRRDVAASTQNQALSALLFLYREVLKKPLGFLSGIEPAKRPVRVPTVLTRAEVARLLAEMEGTGKLIAQLLYGSGLRLLEALRLRVKDVAFGYRQIVVRDARPFSCRHLSRTPPPRRALRIV